MDFSQFEIIDFWDADLCAIGFQKEEKTIYINTFEWLHCRPPKYYLDLEVSTGKELHEFKVVETKKGISEEVLVQEIRTFFEI